ncbi:MAG: HIT domain-containing protein [Alteromonadales bacterium]|nr:HIT domain-containing protein [Alteromonadales bacterium]MCP4991846.1 HIT domain-containing protein [Colwellia sp.]
MNCVFCNIIEGTIPSKIVFENNDCLAIVPIKPESNGHLLVIPKVHAIELDDISDECLSQLTIFTKSVCNKIKLKYGASGFNLLHASGKSAQQSVDHFHIHVIPRFENDGINTWPALKGGEDIYE